jgi:hypothetical protein
MTKSKAIGPYTKVKRLIANKINRDTGKLILLCRKAFPRIPVATIRVYVGRIAWELRRNKKTALSKGARK